jgi:hypothetical protein
MNKIDFTQPGGFPLDQQTLDLMQDNTKLAATAALLGGNLCILKGCAVVGGDVSSGVVVINGEVLPFVAGVLSEKVIIVETSNDLVYEDGSTKASEKIRYAQFGDGDYLWADFKRNDPTNGLLARVSKLEMILKPLLPYTVDGDTIHGCRLEWNRPAIEIPAGWVADDSVEVQGRMPVGYKEGDAQFGEIGGTGGAKTHTLTEDELPEIDIDVPQGDSYNGAGAGGRAGRGADNPNNIVISIGGGQAHSILNPYRVVQYIIFVGV